MSRRARPTMPASAPKAVETSSNKGNKEYVSDLIMRQIQAITQRAVSKILKRIRRKNKFKELQVFQFTEVHIQDKL